MENQEILTGSGAVSEKEPETVNEVMGEITESAAEQSVQPEESAEKSPRKKKNKHPFGRGFALGMILMFLLCGLAFFLLCVGRVLYISGGRGLADAEIIAKANSIATYLQQYSIYEYDETALREGMLDGLMNATGDKYAVYYNADELAAVFTDYDGNFYGIGALIKENLDGEVYISGVYEDSPAEKSGLKAGDVIIAVNGEDVKGLDRYEVAEKMRGEKGTEVTVTVYRESTGETLDCSAVRDKLKKIDVEYRMLTDDIGYIWIKDFDDVAIDQFTDALATLKVLGMKDMVIDLRGNTGGLLRAATGIVRQIMCKGVIFSTEDSSGEKTVFECDGDREFKGRIVILTDGYTASASEIMTGALRDNGMAITIGTNTYGKGLVQDFFFLSDGSGIKFTTDQYFTPNGTAINGVGIAPDIEVEFDYDAYMADGTDNQLDAAIEYLEK